MIVPYSHMVILVFFFIFVTFGKSRLFDNGKMVGLVCPRAASAREAGHYGFKAYFVAGHFSLLFSCAAIRQRALVQLVAPAGKKVSKKTVGVLNQRRPGCDQLIIEGKKHVWFA
jgi:hypothetical protein